MPKTIITAFALPNATLKNFIYAAHFLWYKTCPAYPLTHDKILLLQCIIAFRPQQVPVGRINSVWHWIVTGVRPIIQISTGFDILTDMTHSAVSEQTGKQFCMRKVWHWLSCQQKNVTHIK